MTKPLGRPHAPESHEPVSEFRDQETVEPTDTVKSASSATGVKLRHGKLGFLRGAKAWIGGSWAFRIRRKRG